MQFWQGPIRASVSDNVVGATVQAQGLLIRIGIRLSGRGEWGGMGVCPTLVLTPPEAPSPKVLWQTCQVVSGSPALGSGLQRHHSPWATQAQ